MKKRIRLRQVRVGMFVEELENATGSRSAKAQPFLVKTMADVERVLKSRAMSVVINIRKGLDTNGTMAPAQTLIVPNMRLRFSITSRATRSGPHASRWKARFPTFATCWAKHA